MKPVRLLLLLLVLAQAGYGWEIAPGESRIRQFADRSRIFFSPDPIVRNEVPTGLLFEGEIAPQLFFLPQLQHVREGQELPDVLSAWVTPMIRLRMLATGSAPVIPPSYMPKVTVQYLRAMDWSWGAFDHSLLAFDLVGGHHSNGQEGCQYARQAGTDPDCAGAAGGPLNEINGSFSTNYARAGLAGKLLMFGASAEPVAALSLGYAFERHLTAARPSSNLSPSLSALYAVNRHKLFAEYHHARKSDQPFRWSRGGLRFDAEILDGGLHSGRVGWSVEGSIYLPALFADFGLFARYVDGEEYYNILFTQWIRRIHLGFVHSFDTIQRGSAVSAGGG